MVTRGVGQEASDRFDRVMRAELPSFMVAPASSSGSRHHAYPGGLLQHSIEVFMITCRAMMAAGTGRTSITEEEAANALVASMLHDYNKVSDFDGRPRYVPNILKSGKQSDKKPFSRNDKFLETSLEMGDDRTENSRRNFASSMVTTWHEYVPEGWVSAELIESKYPGFFSAFHPDVRQAIEIHDGGYSSRRTALHQGAESKLSIAIHFADMMSARHEESFYMVLDPTTFRRQYLPPIEVSS